MTTAIAPTPPPAAIAIEDKRRRTEADPDFARLHAATARKLTRCLRTLVANLRRADMADTHAQSVFIHTATDVLRAAYEEAHREGQRDYWQQVSLKPHKQPLGDPDEQRTRQVLAWYAVASLTKMAREAAQASRHAANNPGTILQSGTVKSAEIISENYKLDDASGDTLDQWANGADMSNRVGLQASITWVGLQDGYGDTGRMDPAAPFTLLYWNLEGAAQHCDDCLALASNNPYNAPWVSGGNQLEQTPGDGRTACGASCKCDLSYAPDTSQDEQQAAVKWQDWVQQWLGGEIPAVGTAAGFAPSDFGPYAGYPNVVLPYNAPQWQQNQQGQGQANQPSMPPDVIPTPRTSVLSDDQKAALDRMRDAIEAWDTLRGTLPEAPDMFARIEEMGGDLPTGGQGLPEWDSLSIEQQHTINEMVDALWDWLAATEDVGGDVSDLEQQFSDLDGDGETYLLYGHPPGYSQNRDAGGRWAPGDGGESSRGSGGIRGASGEVHARGESKGIGNGPLGGGIPSGGKKGGSGGGSNRKSDEQRARENEALINRFYQGIGDEGSVGGGAKGSSGKSKDEPTVKWETERVHDHVRENLGKPDLSDHDFAQLMGAENGGHVEVSRGGQITVHGANDEWTATRYVMPGDAAKGYGAVIYNMTYRTRATGEEHEAPADPHYAESLRTQADAANRVGGIDHIGQMQRRGMGDGYHMIPMGMDSPMDEHALPEIKAYQQTGRVPSFVSDSRTISDLYYNASTREWWRVNVDAPHLSFDTTPGSMSMIRLNGYLRSHGKRGVGTTK